LVGEENQVGEGKGKRKGNGKEKRKGKWKGRDKERQEERQKGRRRREKGRVKGGKANFASLGKCLILGRKSSGEEGKGKEKRERVKGV